MASQWLGNAVDVIGTALGLPEMGRSEQIAGYQPTTFTGYDASTGGTSNLQDWRTQNFVVGSGIPNPTPTQDNPTPNPTNNNNPPAQQKQDTSGFNLKDPYTKPAGDNWFWDAADGWKQSGGGSGGSGGPSQAELDAAFNPLFSALGNAESAVRSGYESDVSGVGKRYDTYNKQYEDERSRLMGEATDKQTDFQQTLKSALQEAVKAYNALQQQRTARFGGGSSAGEAVGELARQEYFKQQGNVSQEGVRGEREFAKEFANIGQFISQKKSELDMWKEDALGTLKKNLDSQLANIQMQRGETESAKAQARMSIIQDSINRARAIQDQDTQFRQQLAIAGVNQLQESAGRSFTPAEIQAYIEQFMGGNTAISAGGTTSASYSPTYNKNTKKEDDLAKLQGVV